MEWRVIPFFSNYEVSEYGDVRRKESSPTRKRHHQYKPYVNVDGYLAIGLINDDGEKKTSLIHRLVALAFIGVPEDDNLEVAHNNGSRLFNHPSNLRWATRLENHADLQVHERALKGERNGRAKITEDDVHYIRREYRAIKTHGSGRKVGELDEMFGMSRSTILQIAKGKSWSHISWL
jgi:hypothetical protein